MVSCEIIPVVKIISFRTCADIQREVNPILLRHKLTQTIDGDSLILLDNVAKKLKCFPTSNSCFPCTQPLLHKSAGVFRDTSPDVLLVCLVNQLARRK